MTIICSRDALVVSSCVLNGWSRKKLAFRAKDDVDQGRHQRLVHMKYLPTAARDANQAPLLLQER